METLERAILTRAALREQLRRVETFIADYQAFASGEIPSRPRRASTRICIPGRPAQAFDQMVKVLNDAVGPLSRKEIVAACAASGYQMPGKRPADYVAMLAFRNKEKVEAVEGGYRLRTETAQKQPAPTETNANETGANAG